LKEYGVKKPIVSQGAIVANYVLPSVGDAALGIVTAKHYSDVLDTPENRRFVSAYVKKYNAKPDGWPEQAYVGAKVVGEAIKAIGGRAEDRQRFVEALRKVRFEGPAGTIWFDENQQRVFDVYIRRLEKSGGEYVNRVVDKIPNVSQNWTP
jgi:branched-chain amino acid transport system substrate-binding protein